MITVSASSTIQILPMTTYSGELKTPNSFMIYTANQVMDLNGGYIMVEFADCKGHSKIELIDSLDGRSSGKTASKQQSGEMFERHEFGRTYYYIPLPRDNLYIMVKPLYANTWESNSQNFEKSEYLLKIRYTPRKDSRTSDFHFQQNNRLSLDSYSTIF